MPGSPKTPNRRHNGGKNKGKSEPGQENPGVLIEALPLLPEDFREACGP